MHRRTVAAAAVCLGGLLCLRLGVLEPIWVSSGSMEPTIAAGSLVWLDRTAPRLTDLHSGQPVVFPEPEVGERSDGSILLKRVVAAGGQTVMMKDGVLYVDGVAVTEPYVDQKSIDGVYFGSVTVPAGELFVLGDNRETSIDSRNFGPIPASEVLGTVLGH
ncbi:signal peptidase I [Arthrobacter sp. V4I6]|uniref:signal peptidase I n=1 Tax=unclassified Arthrobacter TaxID=235627 RepID=UPI002780AAA5|nr:MULTISPECIES: signal peptidase I [unclassified Arthrobacter]MDQ0822156.1 signal peptidase I [Arthrobacter sp. V1I7]MDQ0856424.1 signal peptidase I [Arthrobacter sp. V4I6]